MSRFRFRLERVLGVRRVEESLARAEWLEAERSAREVEDQARGLETSVERSRGDLTRLQSSPRLDPADVLLQQALVDRLREQWVQRTIQASRARREADRLRNAMADRRVRVRGLETLESRSKTAWRLEHEAIENSLLDERANRLRAHATNEDEHRAPRGT